MGWLIRFYITGNIRQLARIIFTGIDGANIVAIDFNGRCIVDCIHIVMVRGDVQVSSDDDELVSCKVIRQQLVARCIRAALAGESNGVIFCGYGNGLV